MAARMERFYAENHTYATATIGTGATGVIESAATASGYYTLAISSQSASAYTLTATPAGAQTGDTICGT